MKSYNSFIRLAPFRSCSASRNFWIGGTGLDGWGSVLAVNVNRLSHSDEIPYIETMTEISLDRNLEVLFPFILFFTGLIGTLSIKILAKSLVLGIGEIH